jgi:hypothetical protein
VRTGAAGITDALHAKSQIFLGHADVAPILIAGGEAGRRRLGLIPPKRHPKAGKPLGVGAVDH